MLEKCWNVLLLCRLSIYSIFGLRSSPALTLVNSLSGLIVLPGHSSAMCLATIKKEQQIHLPTHYVCGGKGQDFHDYIWVSWLSLFGKINKLEVNTAKLVYCFGEKI